MEFEDFQDAIDNDLTDLGVDCTQIQQNMIWNLWQKGKTPRAAAYLIVNSIAVECDTE